MGALQLLIALDDFYAYHAKMYRPTRDRKRLVKKLAEVEDISRYLVLETIPELGEYTVWEVESWYDEFKNWEED